jgi:hypothetical protein
VAERLDPDEVPLASGHLYRYELAASYLRTAELVVDIASGVGYGAEILTKKPVDYIGIDKIEPADEFAHIGIFFSGVDLDEWEPNFSWDVSVSFETLEHVANPARLAEILKRARRLIVLSTPTRPTKHVNPYHLHDFTVDDVLALFDDWELVHLEDQPSELSHIFVWQRRAE